VSLNRFERKKNVGLAIEALALLVQSSSTEPETLQDAQLVIAGML